MKSMVFSFAVSSLTVLIIDAAPAKAQIKRPCEYAGQSFTATVRLAQGAKTITCTGEGVWTEGDTSPANCIYANQIYGPGSKIGLKGSTITCNQNGQWE